MGQRTRGTLWCGRALLLASLLLGIVTMHTLGHPSAQPAAHESAPAAAGPQHAGSPHTAHQHAGSQHTARTVSDTALPHEAAPQVLSAPGDTPDGDHGSMHMDPMSVCLAVLGVWSAAALLGAAVVLALRATRARDLLAPVRTRILRALWPLPPPSTSTRLARLSVLRI